MRGVFDEEELDPARQSRDTELTLGTGSLVAIGCGLVLLCAVFFGIGYAAGHQSPTPSAAAVPQAAPDQEPLQASGSIPKPSATEDTPQAPRAGSSDAANGAGASAEATAASASGAAVANPAALQSEVHAALPANGGSQQGPAGGAAQVVRPALTSVMPPGDGQQFMVQIAAVSNPGDAEVLANALKKRDYPVVSKREPADNFIHVRVGPFATRQLAEQWRLKLLNDGYNALVQP